MKLTHMTLTAQITPQGTYALTLLASDSVRSNEAPAFRNFRFEIPIGHRPILEDVETLLRMVAEELSR